MYRPSTFAERLKTALEIKDITKAELSRLTGISRSSLTRYAKGDWEGKQDAVYAIAQALNINEAWLMGYDAPMERTDWDAVLKAAIEDDKKSAEFLDGRTGLITVNGQPELIGCSLCCQDANTRDVVSSLFLSISSIVIAEQTEKLVALNGVASVIKHLSSEKCQSLLNYAHFLELDKG